MLGDASLLSLCRDRNGASPSIQRTAPRQAQPRQARRRHGRGVFIIVSARRRWLMRSTLFVLTQALRDPIAYSSTANMRYIACMEGIHSLSLRVPALSTASRDTLEGVQRYTDHELTRARRCNRPHSPASVTPKRRSHALMLRRASPHQGKGMSRRRTRTDHSASTKTRGVLHPALHMCVLYELPVERVVYAAGCTRPVRPSRGSSGGCDC